MQVKEFFTFVVTGIFVGIFSGIFGVGGGMIAAPAIIYLLKFDHRIAAGTSILAIIFPVLSGSFTYITHQYYHFSVAILIIIGAVLGVQLGTHILKVLSVQVVRYIFIIFMTILACSLFLAIPQRDLVLNLSTWQLALTAVVGFLSGILAGLLGVGGGGVVIPLLILLFGMSDLVAKGCALLMMIPTCIIGTFNNIRYKQINYPAALIIGISAAICAPLGAWMASGLSPFTANVLFACFLFIVIFRTALAAWSTYKTNC